MMKKEAKKREKGVIQMSNQKMKMDRITTIKLPRWKILRKSIGIFVIKS
uniref:Uncharacterized protein MANES_01G272000 n=1 Tax=Rhizophora mucronata TaxID=61149 RepID=A0A2P2MLZ9_RHIMU